MRQRRNRANMLLLWLLPLLLLQRLLLPLLRLLPRLFVSQVCHITLEGLRKKLQPSRFRLHSVDIWYWLLLLFIWTLVYTQSHKWFYIAVRICNCNRNVEVFGLVASALQLQLRLHQPHLPVISHNIKNYNESATLI